MTTRDTRDSDREALRALHARATLSLGPAVADDEGSELVVEDAGRLLAHGGYRRLYGPTAELSLATTSGEGTAAALLLSALCAQAREAGISRLTTVFDGTRDETLTLLRRAARTRELVDVAHDRVEVALLLDAELRPSA